VLPLKDNIPTERFPVVTVLFIAINIAVFAWQLSLDDEPGTSTSPPSALSAADEAVFDLGAIPYRLTHPGKDCSLVERGPREIVRNSPIACEGSKTLREAEEAGSDIVPLDAPPWWVTILTSMFMHGGWLHIIGNMLFLWVFGNNVEDSMGRLKFIFFYLLAGAAAVYAQSAIDTSATVPTIGASGAVAGVLGAYILLHPRARVVTLIFIVFFVTVIQIPAVILLGIWAALQFLPALGQVGVAELGDDGVAYVAHVGGFLFGLAMIKLFARRVERPRLGYG
jgi:membrane associated rhomboid family serine protease